MSFNETANSSLDKGVELIEKGVELIVESDPMFDFRNIDIAIRVPREPETVAALLKRGWKLKEDGYMHNRPFKKMSPRPVNGSADHTFANMSVSPDNNWLSEDQ